MYLNTWNGLFWHHVNAMVEIGDYMRLDQIEELVNLVINHIDPEIPHRPAQVGCLNGP